jgi:hypothetical protein
MPTMDALRAGRLRYVAIAHVTRLGEIEQVNLCDNHKLETYLLLPVPMPDWFVDRVALMRFCPEKQLIDSVKGRKYSEYMILLHLTPIEFKQLFIFRTIK